MDLDDDTIKIGEMPTGSGKSHIAMAQSVVRRGQVIALTKSKNLQTQYGDIYPDCAVLFGRSNYKCIHPESPPNATVVDCLFSTFEDCEYGRDCSYVVAKRHAHRSPRVALNYAYWMVTHEMWKPEYLVLDEAHNLSDIILDWVGTTVTQSERDRWRLPDFPVINNNSNKSMFARDSVEPIDVALQWFNRALGVLRPLEKRLSSQLLTEQIMREKRGGEGLLIKLENTVAAIKYKPVPIGINEVARRLIIVGLALCVGL